MRTEPVVLFLSTRRGPTPWVDHGDLFSSSSPLTTGMYLMALARTSCSIVSSSSPGPPFVSDICSCVPSSPSSFWVCGSGVPFTGVVPMLEGAGKGELAPAAPSLPAGCKPPAPPKRKGVDFDANGLGLFWGGVACVKLKLGAPPPPL
ncbi:hypothetical protein F4818DRAFT_404850, partial [Hypoxylon cercidicola]